jgi:subtilisin family serine protease
MYPRAASPHFVAPFSAYELAGQDLDVAAPGVAAPAAFTRNGLTDYTFFVGTSAAAPHVAGVAALMLQKNPSLTHAQVEQILESSALPLPSDCRMAIFPFVTPGNPNPTFSDNRNVGFGMVNACWPAAQAGHGLLQADAALAATPAP